MKITNLILYIKTALLDIERGRYEDASQLLKFVAWVLENHKYREEV